MRWRSGLLLLLACCGQDAPDVAPDAGFDGAADAQVDAGPSPYGDGECTDGEVAEAEEAIEVTTGLARSGPGLVSAYVAEHQQRLDGIWADCTMELCPLLVQIFDDCSSGFLIDAGGDEDAGEPFNPCYPPPVECE